MKPTSHDPQQSGSASLAEAERRIKVLEAENLKLKSDLADISSAYNVLIKEGDKERFDERRVNVLKSQIVQLERQVLMLTDSLSSRAAILLEIENGLHDIAEIVRAQLETERGAVTVSRDNLKKLVDTAESCRIKLAKNIEESDPEKHSRALLMLDKFVKQPSSRVSLYDVCSGSVEHLNLKHVAKLESSLAQIFHDLMPLRHSLQINIFDEQEYKGDGTISGKVRLSGQLERICGRLSQAAADLMELSLLVPSAPWPPIRRPYLKDITKEDVLCSLPSFPKSRSSEGQQKIEALMKAYDYIITMKSIELEAATRDLTYHQATHKCQQDYTESLLVSMKMAYTDFESTTNEVLCKPLKDILDKYEDLKQTASDSDLRSFLSSFKQNAPQIKTIVEQLEVNKEAGSGADALSSFGDHFFESISKLRAECINKRNKSLSELEEVKREANEYQVELKQLFPSTAQNTTSQQDDKTYQEIIAGTEQLSITEQSKASATESDVSAPSARSRRRAAKIALTTAEPTAQPLKPVKAHPPGSPSDRGESESREPEDCSCGAESSQWASSLRRFTPQPTPEPPLNLSTSRPPLGPIKATKISPDADSPTGPGKHIPSRLPRVQTKPGVIPPSSEGRKTPQSHEKLTPTSKFGTPQSRLSLKPRVSRSHSQDNPDQDSSLSDSPAPSSSMKRSSSLSRRPEWVT